MSDVSSIPVHSHDNRKLDATKTKRERDGVEQVAAVAAEQHAIPEDPALPLRRTVGC